MLTNSRYSNFDEFLKIMKNALPLIGKFLSIIGWFLTITLLLACPNANIEEKSLAQEVDQKSDISHCKSK